MSDPLFVTEIHYLLLDIKKYIEETGLHGFGKSSSRISVQEIFH